MRWILLVMALVASAQAQDYQRLGSVEGVAARLDGTRTQLIYVAPIIDAKAIAEAVRRTAAERGVRVFLLVSPNFVEAPGSYTASLAALVGVQVRLAQVERSFAILDAGDNAVLLEGAMLGSGSAAFLEQGSYALTEREVLIARSELFSRVWHKAIPYLSLVERFESPAVDPEPFDWSIFGGL